MTNHGGSVHSEDPMGLEHLVPQGEPSTRIRKRAARYIARWSDGTEDCGVLLEALGLTPEEGLSYEAQ